MSLPGVYVFKRKGRVAYIGRSDSDVWVRESNSFGQGEYDLTTTIYETPSTRQAFLMECRLYHRHRPVDNANHPAAPAGTNWRCPQRSCPWGA